MINSFADKGTQDIYHRINSKVSRKTLPIHLHKIAYRKLDMLDSAYMLEDLALPPSNHLEALKGKYSIRINKQWRIIFSWTSLGIEDVKIEDYH
jgi:proteic killer suppression protein